MQRVYKSDRRMAAMADMDVTLSQSDKDAIAAAMKEKGFDGKIEVPATLK